jgi:hypothetical protein
MVYTRSPRRSGQYSFQLAITRKTVSTHGLGAALADEVLTQKIALAHVESRRTYDCRSTALPIVDPQSIGNPYRWANRMSRDG